MDRDLMCSRDLLSLSPLCRYFSLVHLVVHDRRSSRCVFGIARTINACYQGRTPKREVDNGCPSGIDAFDRLTSTIFMRVFRFRFLAFVTLSYLCIVSFEASMYESMVVAETIGIRSSDTWGYDTNGSTAS